ncbi:helix-turn-helix domain-containing protein [Parasedimentitalea marina]|uniref:Helix-turn-helix domain-containing protein n=1 Tax=Parasedimentitalea marina TaxID=2483033 RepID=A0A3T0N8C2_9RHOB|nr:helix-turn-helix domain-containing protein [Parasedimentitalea marina]AZV80286.1 helix-turn-helix domain-containing protein [Parasedimentitalea marina]
MSVIENFNLFGERQDLPDVVHCETIEARSLVHNWEFSPHRHGHLHQFLLLDSGSGQVQIEENRHPITSGDLVNIPMGTVHGFTFEPGTQGWVVTVASELLAENLNDTEGLRPVLQQPDLVKYSSEIRGIVAYIFAEYPGRGFARAHVLRALSAVLAGLVARAIAGKEPIVSHADHGLQRRFEMLVEEHHLKHLGVAGYADLLAVTPTHLSRVMRQATGQPASAAIELRLMREARRNLAFSNLGISEIAYQLGFGDPAYFSRVFKRATGLSPRAFRQNLGG